MKNHPVLIGIAIVVTAFVVTAIATTAITCRHSI